MIDLSRARRAQGTSGASMIVDVIPMTKTGLVWNPALEDDDYGLTPACSGDKIHGYDVVLTWYEDRDSEIRTIEALDLTEQEANEVASYIRTELGL